MKFTNLLNSFRSGKVSKKISNRQDVEALKDGCEELTNFILLPNGVLKRRYGTNCIDTHVPLTNGSLYSLKYSQEHSYIVQLVDGLDMDIFAYENREIVMTKGGWSTAPTSKFVRIFDSFGKEYVVQTLLQKNKFYVDSSHDMFSGLKSNPCNKYPDDGWTVTQFSRKMIFTHSTGKYAPFVIDLIITEDTSAKFNVMPWFLDFELYNREADTQYDGGDYVALGGITTPFPPMYKQKYTLEIRNPTGTIGTSGKISKDLDYRMIKRVIINKASLGGMSNYSDLVGTGIKVFHTAANKEGYLLITSVDNIPGATTIGVTAVCVVEPDNDATASTYDTWVLSYWGFNNGYPKASTSYRGRVVFGGTVSAPNRFFIAAVNVNNSASFQNMQTSKLIQDAGTSDFSGLAFYNNTVVTDIAIAAAFNESNAGDIKWIKGRRILHFGTATGEHQITFINGVVAVTNMETQKVSSYSSSNIAPVEGDQKIIYTANDYTTIRTISTNARDYESTDISLSALYPEVQYIRSIAWAEEASSLLYQIPGKLHGICINEQTQVMGFYDFDFPFIVQSFCNLTVAKEEAVISLGINVTVDKEYTVILAQVGASYKLVTLMIDQIDKDFVNGEYHYLDLAKYLTEANPTDSIWSNKTLIVRWDNGTVETAVADVNGAVTLANPDSEPYLIGVRNKARGVTVPINYGARYGQAVGLIKRIDRAVPLLTKSGRMLLGSNNGTLYVPRKSGTGWFEDYEPVMELSNSPDYSIKCVFESYEDEPLNINGIAYRGVTYEGE